MNLSISSFDHEYVGLLFSLTVERTFHADRPVILNVAHLDEVARIAQTARIYALSIDAGQLDGAVAVCRTFHV